MKRLEFSPAARDDLLAIGLYIAEDNPARAESFVTELEGTAAPGGAAPAQFCGSR